MKRPAGKLIMKQRVRDTFPRNSAQIGKKSMPHGTDLMV